MINALSPYDMEAIAFALCGEVNDRLSQSGRKFRFGRKGSLAIDLERRCFTDFEYGVKGGVLDLIVHMGHASSRAEAMVWLREFLGGGWRRPESQPLPKVDLSEEARIKRAREVFAEARHAAGTPAEKYLRSRAIDTPIPPSLRYHSHLFNREVKTRLPALVAAVTPLDAPEMITAVLRTYITSNGHKANVPTPKKTVGSVLSGGVILARFTDDLLVGEGIETTMSASAALGIPGVATLGTSGMMRLIVPETVQRVVIAYDVDPSGAGRNAAEYLARRLWAQDVEVHFARPPGNHNDWNDAARAGATGKE